MNNKRKNNNMRLSLLVGIQQKFNDPISFIAEEKSRLVAEGLAHLEYIERKAYMAVVIEVDKFLTINTEQLVEVFKIERTCKCLQIQRFFKYSNGTSFWRCVTCGIQYSKEEEINAIDTGTESHGEVLSETEEELEQNSTSEIALETLTHSATI